MRYHGLFLLVAGVSLTQAQGPSTSEYATKVVLLERLCRFVEWPGTPPIDQDRGPFVLAVVGQSPFGEELDAYFLTHRIKGRPVTVKYFRGPRDLGPCDLLFISSSERGRLPEILTKTAGLPTLTVGDTEGYAARGVLVNIVPDRGHLGFEINLVAARAAGLQLASSFLKVARTL
jgi:hypothetical protein